MGSPADCCYEEGEGEEETSLKISEDEKWVCPFSAKQVAISSLIREMSGKCSGVCSLLKSHYQPSYHYCSSKAAKHDTHPRLNADVQSDHTSHDFNISSLYWPTSPASILQHSQPFTVKLWSINTFVLQKLCKTYINHLHKCSGRTHFAKYHSILPFLLQLHEHL